MQYVDSENNHLQLYFDDILIFGTNLRQAEFTKASLSSSFVIKEMEKFNLILKIKIKHRIKDYF